MASKPNTAFVTFDGASAKAFLYERAEKKLTQLDGFPMSGAKKPDFADKQGRVFQSASERRSGAEPSSDPEKLLERDFVSEVAEQLDKLRAVGAFAHLIVAAGPRALGYWRDVAPKSIADVVKKELTGDYSSTDRQALLDVVEKAFWA